MVLRRLWDDELGQGSAEYALLLAGVVVLTIAATVLFREEVETLFNSIGTYVNTAIL